MLSTQEFDQKFQMFRNRTHSNYDLLYSWMWCAQCEHGPEPLPLSDVWAFMTTHAALQFTSHYGLHDLMMELVKVRACWLVGRDHVKVRPPSDVFLCPIEEIRSKA
jgi:hypothetical protein